MVAARGWRGSRIGYLPEEVWYIWKLKPLFVNLLNGVIYDEDFIAAKKFDGINMKSIKNNKN